MSHTAPSDADPFADVAPPPNSDPGSGQDVPAALAQPSVALQPALIPENEVPQQSTEEMTAKDTTSKTLEGPTDQPEPPTEGQVIECDQAVSLEPEAAEEDVEVCSTSFLSYS